MGHITSELWTLTKLRMPLSPRSNSCMMRPYSTWPRPAAPNSFMVAPKKPICAISGTSSRGKRPSRAQASMMGMIFSSTQRRALSRTKRSFSESESPIRRKSTSRNFSMFGPVKAPAITVAKFAAGSVLPAAGRGAAVAVALAPVDFEAFAHLAATPALVTIGQAQAGQAGAQEQPGKQHAAQVGEVGDAVGSGAMQGKEKLQRAIAEHQPLGLDRHRRQQQKDFTVGKQQPHRHQHAIDRRRCADGIAQAG